MNIGIVGMGLIGGSLAKAIKKYTSHLIYAEDLNESILKRGIEEGIIEGRLNRETLKICDYILIALYPKDTVSYIKNHSNDFQEKAVVIDCCGVKQFLCNEIFPIAKEGGFTFIGGHPMAGLEVAGYENAFAELYKGASMILTPPDDMKEALYDEVSRFFYTLGFGHMEITTAEIHDKNIAFTSQLAHIVSNAYIKSPSAEVHKGFSAGSYRDLTRVAKLEEHMWTELFLENRQYLAAELKTIIYHLTEYQAALENCDADTLLTLLKTGSKRKEKIDKQ